MDYIFNNAYLWSTKWILIWIIGAAGVRSYKQTSKYPIAIVYNLTVLYISIKVTPNTCLLKRRTAKAKLLKVAGYLK